MVLHIDALGEQANSTHISKKQIPYGFFPCRMCLLEVRSVIVVSAKLLLKAARREVGRPIGSARPQRMGLACRCSGDENAFFDRWLSIGDAPN